jgi:RNA polymerase sigma factor (sigma-70 family)
MNRRTYEEMVEGLLAGNNALLAHLNSHQTYCLKTLQIKSGQHCTADMAYDIFIDAVIAFRTNILKGERPDPRYLRAYLARICWNMWMAHSRSQERKAKKQGIVQEELYGTAMENFDHLTTSEEERMEALEKGKKLQIIQRAMENLNEKCRKILQLFIIEGKSMKEIAEQLNMANANVAKTTKSRCYNRLMKEIHE